MIYTHNNPCNVYIYKLVAKENDTIYRKIM